MTKYTDLIRDLHRGKLLPLYLFFGEEEFLMQEALDLIRERIVDPASRDFNSDTIYGKGSSGDEIVGLCQTLPFMTERRLVVVKEVDALKAADLDELQAYLQDPAPSTCLVMIASDPRYDRRSFIAAVEARGAVTRFYPLLEREIASWIEKRVIALGLAIERDAVQYVWQTIGNDLQSLSSEIEKSVIFVKDRKNITYEDVRMAVGDFREYTPFDLADALGRRDRQKAFLVLNRLLQEGEQPVGLLASIAWNFRRLMRAKSMEAAGVGYEEIKKKLRVIFHQSAAFQQQMRSYTLPEIEGFFGALLSADRALKSSGLGGRLVLERMIIDLCGG
jgi:DNA polymerase-3 subunit delta